MRQVVLTLSLRVFIQRATAFTGFSRTHSANLSQRQRTGGCERSLVLLIQIYRHHPGLFFRHHSKPSGSTKCGAMAEIKNKKVSSRLVIGRSRKAPTAVTRRSLSFLQAVHPEKQHTTRKGAITPQARTSLGVATCLPCTGQASASVIIFPRDPFSGRPPSRPQKSR